MRLFTSPDAMGKYNLIKPMTITNIAAIYVYYVQYNKILIVSCNFQVQFSYKKSRKAGTFHFL